MYEVNPAQLEQNIRRWLDEDIGMGDITSITTLPIDHRSKGIIHVKQAGVIAGLFVANSVFRAVDSNLRFTAVCEEGDRVEQGTILAEVEGSTQSILSGERLALNLLQRLSGIATRTRQFVDALDGLPVRLVDTRKTTPGHRTLEKYAVRVGGGHNHRFGLYDAVMIKDNHIKGAGGITSAVYAARAQIPHTMKIEVEVENRQQLQEALQACADIIMLDNMSLEEMTLAVKEIKRASEHIIAEASGAVNLETIKGIAQTGVDIISVGRLTYSVESLDISLDLQEKKGAAAR